MVRRNEIFWVCRNFVRSATLGKFLALSEALNESQGSADARAERNALLRDKLESMKTEVSGQLNALMTGMMGGRPEDFLSDDEINKHFT